MRLRYWIGICACLVVVLLVFMSCPRRQPARVNDVAPTVETKSSDSVSLDEPRESSTRAIALTAQPPVAGSDSTKSPRTLGSLRVHVVSGDPAAGCPQIGVLLWSQRFGYEPSATLRKETDAQGYALFQDLRPGHLDVSTTHDATKTLDQTKTVELKPGEHAEVELVLETGFTLRGQVRSENGDPIGQAAIVLCKSSCKDACFEVAQTRADGTFEVAHVQIAQGIAVRASSHVPSGIHPIPNGGRLEIVLRPTERGHVCGVVVDGSARPIANAVVRLRINKTFNGTPDALTGLCPTPEIVTHTDPQGKFSIADAPDGKVTLNVVSPGFVSQWFDAVAKSPGDCSLTLQLKRGGTIKGIVVDASGAAVPFAWVGTVESKELLATESDENGAFELAGVPPGSVHVEAARRDGRGRVTVLVQNEAVIECKIVLSEGRVIAGRATVDDGEPLSRWWIGANTDSTGQWQGQWAAMTRTNESGEFRLLNCPPGEFVLECVPFDMNLLTVGSAPVSATEAGPVNVVIPRERMASSFVVGSIFDMETGAVIQGAQAFLRADGARRSYHYSADADTGAYRAGPAPAGSYTLYFQAKGFVSTEPKPITLSANQTLDAGRCRLQPGGYLVIRRTETNSRDATLFVMLEAPGQPDHKILFRGTVSRSDALAPGNYTARWSFLGVEKTKTVVVEARETREVVLD